MRLASNSAITARIWRNIRANGSFQSYAEAPSAKRTPRVSMSEVACADVRSSVYLCITAGLVA